ncbi:MAG: amino acid adenylation domain-containing protein, partial [Phycisphaerales bacterium]
MNAPTTILDLFAEARARHAEALALDIPPDDTRPRRTRTYAELDAMAAQVASLVRATLGARPARDAVVALALPRTDPWLYAAMLGSMRAGCAYVAIDPAFPARQAAEIVRDAAAVMIVAERPRADEIAGEGGLAPPVTSEDLSRAPRLGDADAPAPHDLAYVIYTSGTTGRPKGVEIEHRSILNLVAADIPEYGLGPHDRVAQGSSASYDSSVEEIWLAWAVGATVVVMDDATARLGPDLVEWLVRERVTVLCPPPTLLRTLACDDPARALPEIRLLYVGGEALPQDVADLWSRGRRLENGYGPTECTVTCLRSTVRAGEPVTIGRAVPNATAHVIDPDDPELRVVDGHAHGELVVGGASLARGYRGQPETTAARFIEHPSLGRVYRTGDLVHRDAHGEFHYHGRIDAQVKLRGYRVELGAIEARLAAHESVREAAAAVEGEGAQRRLVAHVVLAAGAALDADALRAFVAAGLPAYMVPVAIAPIERGSASIDA